MLWKKEALLSQKSGQGVRKSKERATRHVAQLGPKGRALRPFDIDKYVVLGYHQRHLAFNTSRSGLLSSYDVIGNGTILDWVFRSPSR